MTGFTSRRAIAGAIACALALLGAPSALRAQPVADLSGSAEIASTRLVRIAGTSRTLAGPLLGASGRIAFRLVELEGRYAEGSLGPVEGTTGLDEDLVEGSAVLWVRPRAWIAFGAGPQLRAFLSPSGTAHWTRFDVRSRVVTDVIPGLATAHLEGWIAVAATSNVQGGGESARGAEAGLTVRIPRLPLSARIGYVADRATFASGASEFIEGVRFSLLLGPF